jgi:hypothetical protein
MASKKSAKTETPAAVFDTSDNALARLLTRIKMSDDPDEIRELSKQLERVIFHKQFTNA